MGMIDRYKKRGGFVQLVQLIETTSSPKKEQFLKMIADENPTWEAAVKQRLITLERMTKWNAAILMEFLPSISHMAIACAVHPLTEEQRTFFLSTLSFGDRKKVEDIIKEHKPNSGEVASSQMKIIGEVRKLAANGKLKFEKFDMELHIPEDIEEDLKSGGGVGGGSAAADILADIKPAAAGGGSAAANEEAAALRRKLVALTQENSRLMKENKDVKDKLEAIKSAVLKAS